MICIASSQEGFRRCGIAHAKEPKYYPDGFFNQEQLKSLRAEPKLVIQEDMPDSDAILANAAVLDEMNEAMLKELCDKRKIKYPAKAGKADLIALLKSKPGKSESKE